MNALVRYEQARAALAECARIDEASDIRDKAAALAAYARQRDDRDLEVWVREIQLRACVRIGELSRELDQAKTLRVPGGATVRLPTGGKSKAEALSDAGLTTSTAHRYEALAGSRDAQAQAAGNAAMEAYFARSRVERAPPTMSGLRHAIRGAIHATLGPCAPRPPKQPAPKPIGDDWVDFTGAVSDIASLPCDLADLASRMPSLRTVLLTESQRATTRLMEWTSLLEHNDDKAH